MKKQPFNTCTNRYACESRHWCLPKPDNSNVSIGSKCNKANCLLKANNTPDYCKIFKIFFLCVRLLYFC